MHPHPEHLRAAHDAISFMPARPMFVQTRRFLVWVVLLACLSVMRAVVRLLPQEWPLRMYVGSTANTEPWRWRDLPTSMGWRD